jgi:hypothetical protein
MFLETIKAQGLAAPLRGRPPRTPEGAAKPHHKIRCQPRSKRSAFMTFVQAATKSSENFS